MKSEFTELAVKISQQLIQIPSYSGVNREVIKSIIGLTDKLGFKCEEVDFEGSDSYAVNNLHAIYNPKKSAKTLYFAGHSDVVKEGKAENWRFKPFAAEIHEDRLYGRGACDMKCAIACFIAAVAEFLDKNPQPKFGIGLLITNDEENDGVNGTKKMLDWMQEKHFPISYCLVGEPTNPTKLGEMIKIGRRGSINFTLKITGKQGHVAYPNLALNPITILIQFLSLLKNHKFDEGNQYFEATNLEITNISSPDFGNNVIPNQAECAFNVRFNDLHSSQSIIELVNYACEKSIGGSLAQFQASYELHHKTSGESFLSEPAFLAKIVANANQKITGLKPILGTNGGTSDARFIKNFAEVVEIGLVNQTAHQNNEFSKISEIQQLQQIYLNILHQIQASNEL